LKASVRRVSSILVTDVDSAALDAMAGLLRPQGYAITIASDGLAALAELRGRRPNLVLWNVALPGVSPVEVMAEVRTNAALSRVMLVLLGGRGAKAEQITAGLDAGADDFVAQPVDDHELLARVRSYLRRGERLEQLRASERQFASSFAHAAVGMALVAPDGRYLKVNRALCQMLGYAEEQLLRRTFRELTHPEDLDDGGNVRRLLAGEIAWFHMEKRYLHSAGHWVWGLLSVSLVRDGNGEPLHQVAQIQDITGRKAAEDRLRESERVLRQTAAEVAAQKARLVEAQAVAKVGSWETDVRAGTVGWSDETHRIFETDPARFQPTHAAFVQLVHPDDRLRVDQAFARSLAGREPCAIQHRLLMPDGRVKIVEERWRIFFADDGAPLRAVGTCQDITEREEAEQRLRLSEARYRTLFECAPYGITISDPAGRHLDANPSFCRMLGYPRPELLKLEPMEVISPGARPLVVPGSVESTLADSAPEWQLCRKDGSWFSAEVLTTSMPDGNVLRMVRDITIRKAHEQEILRWSRLYAALSHVNQAIVAARTRQELFTRVCRALVEFGGFRMAWIGWLDPATSRVVPVAQWGDDGNYLSQVEIFADDRTKGRSLVNSAIREASYRVSNDFSNDPATVAWRAMATANNIRAGAAFPIREGGTVCGAMMVYSEEGGVFQDKEIGLLKEAAGDVCFGIDNLNRDAARQQVEEELRAAERQLHSLIGRLHYVREDEAKRIARELHDDLGQKLTVLNMELTYLETKLPGVTAAQLKQIERMREVVNQTIERVQKISGELRLGQLDVLGLAAAIEWHLQDFTRQAGLKCRITRLDEALSLSEIQRTTIFRIMQEALTNVARHAGATEVTVSLEVGLSEVVLTVADNGRGITAREVSDRNSIGLLGMRERALLVGGEVTVTGADGAGTNVRVRIPLNGPAAW
jgi:PAS domain S-box-containing protein